MEVISSYSINMRILRLTSIKVSLLLSAAMLMQSTVAQAARVYNQTNDTINFCSDDNDFGGMFNPEECVTIESGKRSDSLEWNNVNGVSLRIDTHTSGFVNRLASCMFGGFTTWVVGGNYAVVRDSRSDETKVQNSSSCIGQCPVIEWYVDSKPVQSCYGDNEWK